MQQGKLNKWNTVEEADPAGAIPENVDVLVSGFLEELANISSNLEEIPQPEIVEETPVSKSPLSEPVPPIPKTDEESRPESGPHSEEIDNEIEESLNELERLKSKVIPIADRKGSESGMPSKTEIILPAAETAVQANVVSEENPANPSQEEQAWDRLELFRSQIASRKPFPWMKSFLLIAVLIVILGIPAYQLFRLRSAEAPTTTDATASVPGTTGDAPYSNLEISQNVIKAERITEVPPLFPRSAGKQRITGTVVLEADISEKGDVVRAKAVSGPALFRTAAEEALMKWKFKPASANGIDIASKERISIDFDSQ